MGQASWGHHSPELVSAKCAPHISSWVANLSQQNAFSVGECLQVKKNHTTFCLSIKVKKDNFYLKKNKI